MKKTILVTEDSATVSAMIKQALEDEGYGVITATDGMEALNKAEQEKPNLIVLDLMLPKLDGYKVCGMLKINTKYKNIPIIILTARGGESDKNLGKEIGADAYITKPFKPEALLAKIKELLHG